MPRHHHRVRALALVILGTATVASWGCKSTSTPVPVVVPPPVVIAPDRKAGWILRLELQRTLRDDDIAPVTTPPADAIATRVLTPAAAAGLDHLALDPDPSVRRRAILAIGRVGMLDGLPHLVAALQDNDAEVRAVAAFAIGLIGPDAREGARPLRAALDDPSPLVRARAVEALGLVGDAASAPAIITAAEGCGGRIATIG